MTTLASFFNLAGPDLFVIFFIILLLFGAKKLPELAKGLGQAVKEFSRAKDDFEREVTQPTPQPPSRQIDEPKVAQNEQSASADHPEHAEHNVPTTKVS